MRDSIDALRIPPHSTDAEQAVLGGLMLDERAFEKIADKITEDDFYRKDHRLIFRAVNELSAKGQPCDAVTMAEWFDKNGLSELVGGSNYVIRLASNTPSAANVVAYAEIVREKSVLRQLIDAGSDIAGEGFKPDGRSTVEILDAAIARLMAMQRIETRNEFTLRQAMTQAYKAAQEAQARNGAIVGIASGIDTLDRILGGWHDSDLIVIGARPAMGKTALLLNMAVACKVPCGIISAEQPAQQVGARVMSIESHVAASKLRNGDLEAEDLGRLANAVARLIEVPCMVYDRSSPTIADVTRMTRKWVQQIGIKVLFVDYVQRIEGTDRREKKHERVGEVVRGLKNLARDLGIPVVALCQVNRDVDKRQDRRPNMGDMSDSSEIEKEADQILTLYRDEVYDPESADAGTAEITIEKNRHGPTGFVRTAWLAETMRFENLAHAA